jgi:(p)ppGpp synthase/HD superfamily hydrolase
MKFLNEQLDKAISFAVEKHKNQFRKTDPSVPYVYHPVSVGFILLKAGFDDEVVTAGILHDVVEDAGVTVDELRSIFGEKVASLVEGVSEDKRDSWEKRKEDYLNKIISSSPEVKAISAADKLHNIYSLINFLKTSKDTEGIFKRGKNVTIAHYINFVEKLSESWHHPIVEDLKIATEELKLLLI